MTSISLPDGGWAGTLTAVREGRVIPSRVVGELLGRGFTVARALTAALPLLGLLDTVTGVVDTFGRLGGGGSAARVDSPLSDDVVSGEFVRIVWATQNRRLNSFDISRQFKNHRGKYPRKALPLWLYATRGINECAL